MSIAHDVGLMHCDESPDDALIRDRAVRLFRYLAALAELRSKTVRDLASYEEVFWISDLPHEKECDCAAWQSVANEEQPWLRIKKPEKPLVPAAPIECRSWQGDADLSEASIEPGLVDEISDLDRKAEPPEAETDLAPAPKSLLIDRPDVVASWGRYLEEQWRPWRAEWLRYERVMAAYRRLFSIYQEQQRRGEQYELVLGIGTLLWTSRSGHKINRPIVTTRVSILLEAASGEITVSPVADGANFDLEQDMLDVSERPPNDEQSRAELALARLSSPWTRDLVTPILKGWLNALPAAADGAYDDVLGAPAGPSRSPKMCFAPLLILRRRGGRTMREALRKVEKQLESGGPVPAGIASLCSVQERLGDTNGQVPPPGEPPEEILFPLPTNEEQLAIIHRLGRRSGVLVQGPPGTGKSHTIANLICHLLAAGKRVLVTSQTPRALKVLRDKVPESIRPLTVSVLGEDRESQVSREEAVQSIRRKHQCQDSRDLERQIRSEANRRDSIRCRLADLRRRLREIRESETQAVEIGATRYRGTPAAIAKELSTDHGRFDWLTDDVATDAAVPLCDQEILELFELWNHCQELPRDAAAGLPEAAELRDAVSRYARAKADLAVLESASGWSAASQLSAMKRSRLQRLCALGEEFIAIASALDKCADEWIADVKREVLTNRASHWIAVEEATRKAIDAVSQSDLDVADNDLQLPNGVSRAQVLADAGDLFRHLKNGRSVGVWPFRARVARRTSYLWKSCRFKGRLCDCPDALSALICYLSSYNRLDRAWQEWSQFLPQPRGSLLRRLSALKECNSELRNILRLGELQSTAEQILAEEIDPRANIIATVVEQLLGRAPDIALHLAELREAEDALSSIDDRVARVLERVARHPALEELASAAADRDAARYEVASRALQSELARLERRSMLDDRLASCAPRLAEAIRSPSMRKTLAASAGRFEAAWAWKRGRAWLDRFLKNDASEIAAEVARKERDLQAATEELAAHKAWQWCLQRLEGNPGLEAALEAWSQEVDAIGKGTGKHAERHRRNARKYLQQCSPAIPAWIMPLYRVIEQVEPHKKAFDVVIVDEASQTGPEGLILQYLADKCVIVGDDKQISPEAGFIDGHEVHKLIEQHLDGIPFCETITPATSLFDQAEIRYGNRITLREHFRCMPEIIRFSNEQCYSGTPLIPLRQYRPPRLTPIEVRFVTDAYREGKGQHVVNRPEAAALAKSVVECLDDPRYSGKSFGVICLQGHAQAHAVENMLLEALGPRPFKDKSVRLLCGDPYSFQGDERDVIFLSMVAAIDGDARNAPLTRNSFKQRFNVAVSRARDQLWLFHSVRETELNPACMRRQLINFCRNYPISSEPPPNAEYDSDFERHVAEDLGLAGYRTIPRFEIAGKRIDLVVGDGQTRLAIECDGDQWHGPDQYEADMLRERMLERCGWQFIRVRASAFYSNRRRAVQEIVEAICAHGLAPNNTVVHEQSHCDWVREVSGAECLAELKLNHIKVGPNNSSRQRGLFEHEPQERQADTRDAHSASAEEAPSRPRDREAETAPSDQRLPEAAASISEEERTAILRTLRKQKEPSGVTRVSVDTDVKKLRLAPQRLKKILRILESENLVTRYDTPKGPRYSAR